MVRIKYGLLLLILLAASLPIVACEPGAELLIVNRTDQVLTITKGDTLLAEVAPGVEIRTIYLMGAFTTTIIATNSQSEILYSKRFSGYELENLGGRVIIAHENAQIGGPNNLVITNREPLLITITINGCFIARVIPHAKISVGYETGETRYQIEIKNVNGQVIYSENFTGNQLLKMQGKLTNW